MAKIIQISGTTNNSGHLYLFALDDEGKMYCIKIPDAKFEWNEIKNPIKLEDQLYG